MPYPTYEEREYLAAQDKALAVLTSPTASLAEREAAADVLVNPTEGQ